MKRDEVISGLYAAANGRIEWQQALGQVAGHLDLWVVQVLGVDKRNGQLMFSSYGGNALPQTSLDYFRYYSSIDPRVPVGMATPSDQWMHCHEHFGDHYVSTSEFYQDFLIPHGGRYVSATKLIDDPEVQFILAFMRGNESAPMQAGDLPVLLQFKHHFTEAFSNLVHLRETYAELGMARELLGQFSYPMLLIDDMGSIWHRNPAAEAVLRQADPVMDQNGYLTASTRSGRDALAAALHEVLLQRPAPGQGPHRIALALPTSGGRRFLAFISAIRPEVAMGAFGRAPRALVILHDVEAALASVNLSSLIVGECFDLTPAEARVAVQVAQGMTVKEMAGRNGTAVSTIQSHVKAVMAKVEVERQADLVRVLLTMPVRK